jgi:hypothetical protein
VTRQEIAWLNTHLRRFAAELGIEANRTRIGRVAKTADTPTKAALLMGDQAAARQAMKRYLARYESDAARTMAMKSLAASIRSSQPIKVGGAAGADRRTLFLQWTRKRFEDPGVRSELRRDSRRARFDEGAERVRGGRPGGCDAEAGLEEQR